MENIEAKRQLAKEQKRLRELTGKADQQAFELRQRQAQDIENLYEDRERLQKEKRMLKSRIKLIKRQLEHEFTTRPEQLERLRTFFPGIEIAAIEKVDNFHASLASILDDALNQQLHSYQQSLVQTEEALGHTEAALIERELLLEISPDIADEIAQRAKKIESLKQ